MTSTLTSTLDGALDIADITVAERQLRISETDALTALRRVIGESADKFRARLRYGPGATCEQLARLLDKALIGAEDNGLGADALIVVAGSAHAAEEIVRVRRKAHGVADFISSPTSDVTIVLRPRGLVDAAPGADAVTGGGHGSVDADPIPSVEPELTAEAESAAALQIREALYDVVDPDLGVNDVDLGFIRRIHIADDGSATIVMTLTSAACPLTGVMEGQMRTVLADLGIEFVVEWEWLPTWRPADITEDGRDQLRAIGFTAF
ncbi:hypothetical protein GPOL_c08480 [Gordonia polyisoprenivorans VH2]|uniref:50S ribosomal protein L22 n=1 Tax=Gordonia polyisoprenivorans (strain DSM 44266 / VH2) TaxID=1112204 RepID=H6MYN6_GORPV|nr:iron-sulfur cluster assembly protein [Gordonia polyisoprenivorans]AFA71914.1 hypothetical protein GPOL_c08480 [Gordonia polyisoprenivorans VH2]